MDIFIILLICVIATAGIAALIAYLIPKSDRYYVRFVKLSNGVRKQVGRKKRVQPDQQKIIFRKKSYEIDCSFPVYGAKQSINIVIDIESGQQITTTDMEQMKVDPRLRKLIWADEVLRQLVAGLGKAGMSMESWMLILLAGIAFFAVGYLLGNVVPISHIGGK